VTAAECVHPREMRLVRSDGRRFCECGARLPDYEPVPETVEKETLDDYLDETRPP